MKTSYYANKALTNRLHAPIGISRGAPRFQVYYTVVASIANLAPDFYMLRRLEGAAFEEAYRAKLERVGVEWLSEKFAELERAHPDRELVLLCFERPGEVCHRRMFAAWWHEQTGEVVEELGGQRVTQLPLE
jgi:hypothetical protein